MNKKWQIAKKIDDNFIKEFPEIDSNTLQLLYNRGIISQDEIDRFLTPDYGTDLRDPFLFKDMERAVRRIFEALKNGEKITIFGDYDADGVTASVVLKKALEEVGKGGIMDVYIPHRGREGYGLNKEALEYIQKKGCKLVITVDCGISNYEEVAYGKSLGMDIIITDHHQPPIKLPEAYAILNPKVEGCGYPFKGLAGVGVAFKLAQALIRCSPLFQRGGRGDFSEAGIWVLDFALGARDAGRIKNASESMEELRESGVSKNPPVPLKAGRPPLGKGVERSSIPQEELKGGNLEGFEKWLLDLVAVGTIADLCPLVDENRVLVKYGLIVLNKTKNIGLKALFDVAGLPAQAGLPPACAGRAQAGIAKSGGNDVRCGKESRIMNVGDEGQKSKLIDTWNVGFQIAPRLNAAGRLSHANTAFKLLTTEDEDEAFNIARELDDTNNKRQILTKNATEEAIEIIKNEGQEGNLAIFAKNKNWESGIIGLVAGRLVEHYNKPAFIFTKIGNEIVASGRSIPDFDIMKALVKKDKNKISPSSYLRRYGGHSQACGFSLLKEEVYEKFIKSLLEVASNELKGKDLSPYLFIDAEIGVGEADWNLRDSLEAFAPFGQINPQPLFAIKNLEILEIKVVGKEENHLKLKFRKGNSAIGAIGFQMNNNERSWVEKLHIGDIIDAACYVEVNEWNGNREIQLKIVDIKLIQDNDIKLR